MVLNCMWFLPLRLAYFVGFHAGLGATPGKLLRSERYYGVQTRRFSLAQDIDESRASAKCENGVLELILPKKKSGTGAKKLEIR